MTKGPQYVRAAEHKTVRIFFVNDALWASFYRHHRSRLDYPFNFPQNHSMRVTRSSEMEINYFKPTRLVEEEKRVSAKRNCFGFIWNHT